MTQNPTPQDDNTGAEQVEETETTTSESSVVHGNVIGITGGTVYGNVVFSFE